MMKWFTVNIFFEGVDYENSEIPSLWEESILIVNSENIEQAKIKAERFAKAQETEYVALQGNKIKWVFRSIGEVYELDKNELKDGMEIFSRFLRDSEAKSLLRPFEE